MAIVSITDNSNAHKTAIENTGVGLYYGDHSPFHDSILRGDHRALKAQIDAMSLGNWRLDSFEPGAVVHGGCLRPGGACAGEFVYRVGN